VSEINVLQIQLFWAVILCSRRTTSWYFEKHFALTFKCEEFFFYVPLAIEEEGSTILPNGGSQ